MSSPEEKRIVKSLHELDDVIKKRREMLQRLSHPEPITPKTPEHPETEKEIAERKLLKEKVLSRKRQIKELREELENQDEKRSLLLSRVQKLERDREDCGRYIQMLSKEKNEMEKTLLDVAKYIDDKESHIYQLSALHDADSKRLNMAQIREYQLKRSLIGVKRELLVAKRESSRYCARLPSPPELDVNLSLTMPELIAQQQKISKVQKSTMKQVLTSKGSPNTSMDRSESHTKRLEVHSSAMPEASQSRDEQTPWNMPDASAVGDAQPPWEAGLMAFIHGITIVLLFVALGMWNRQ